MAHEYSFGTVEYRNGIYQGYHTLSLSHGVGIFLDDQLQLHCSIWKHGLLDSKTAIIVDHGKYIYGQTTNGKLKGLNVFRSGEGVLLGNFQDGKLEGQFVVVFEAQCLVLVGQSSQESICISQCRGFSGDQQLGEIINGRMRHDDLPSLFSIVDFLQNSFCFQKGPFRMYSSNGMYRFGFQDGLGVVFKEDNSIQRMGCMDSQGTMCGLGVQHQNIVQTGNFTSGMLIKYEQHQKPTADIRRLLRSQHIRSISFRNDFLLTRGKQIVQYLDLVLSKVVEAISDDQLQSHNNTPRNQLTESLQYQSKSGRRGPSAETERLFGMREQLMRSVNRPVEIKPDRGETSYISQYPDDMKRLFFLDEKDPEVMIGGFGRTDFLGENKFKDYLGKQKDRPRFGMQYPQPRYPYGSSSRYYQGRNTIPVQGTIEQKSSQGRQARKSKSPQHLRVHKHCPPNPYKDPLQLGYCQPVVMASPNEYHTNKRVEQLIEEYNKPNPGNFVGSPFRKNLINNHIRSKQDPKQGSPSKKDNGTKEPSPHHRDCTEVDRQSRSYLTMFRNSTSENTTSQKQVQRVSQKNLSPLKSHNDIHYPSSSSKRVHQVHRQSHYQERVPLKTQGHSPSAHLKTTASKRLKYNYMERYS